MNSFGPKVVNLVGPADDFDVAVIGGGIMGCATALNLARGGMRTVLLERRGLCMEASGVNAGTLPEVPLISELAKCRGVDVRISDRWTCL